jgi:glutamyl-tRNA synthetase
MAGFFFRPPPQPATHELVPKGLEPAQALALLRDAHQRLEAVPAGGFTHDAIEPPLRALAGERGVKPGVLFGILRVAITGQSVSPPLFESMVILGRQRTLERTANALAALAAP